MTARRVLVTGGSGFIGTNLVDHLDSRGYEVRNLDVSPPRQPAHVDHWVRGDVRDAGTVRDAVDAFAPQLVCHLAARCDLGGATVADYDADTRGLENVIAALARCPQVERVLFASTQLVCTPGHIPTKDDEYSPPNAYGASKVIGERIVREQAGDAYTWALLRPTSIWGPWWGRVERTFFETVRRGLYVHPKGVRIRKSFGYVGNTVRQIDALLDVPPDSLHRKMLYVADYDAYPILDWAQDIAKAYGARRVREVPLPVLRVAARAGDALKRVKVDRLPLTTYRLRNMLTESIFDMGPLHALCGDVPFTRQQGTQLTVDWLRAETGHRS